MENLGINIFVLLAQIINFGILVLVLNKYLYKPVLKAIHTKKHESESLEKEREELEMKAQKQEEEHNKILKEAKARADQIVAAAEAEMLTKKKKVIEDAELRAQSLVKKASEEMGDDRKKLEKEFESAVSKASFVVSREVVEKLMDEKLKQKSVDEAIARLKKASKKEKLFNAF